MYAHHVTISIYPPKPPHLILRPSAGSVMRHLVLYRYYDSTKTENHLMKMQVNENRNTPTEMISPNCKTRCRNLLAVPIFANGIVCSRYYFSF